MLLHVALAHSSLFKLIHLTVADPLCYNISISGYDQTAMALCLSPGGCTRISLGGVYTWGEIVGL